MKQAISYIRISNKDQSNFSLSGQQEQIKQYCERKQISLINSFLDNGQSAKNFDRADWKNLENFVKQNYKSIDYIIVVKYDRFSRNVAEALNMMDKLEKKYSISILSVFEEMHIDPASPFFFKMRTDMLVQAEFELRVIKDRTNFGTYILSGTRKTFFFAENLGAFFKCYLRVIKTPLPIIWEREFRKTFIDSLSAIVRTIYSPSDVLTV